MGGYPDEKSWNSAQKLIHTYNKMVGLKNIYKLGMGGVFFSFSFAVLGAWANADDPQINSDVSGDESYIELVNNPELAKQNWILNCQGCHKVGAVGLAPDMPNLNGEVAKLLKVEGGFEYIGRVNGITNAPLSNEDLADLVNWMLVTYDPQNLPSNFSGFRPEQIAEFRKSPLKHDIVAKRQSLAMAIDQLESPKN